MTGRPWTMKCPLSCNCFASVVPSQGQRLRTAVGRLLTAVEGVTDGGWGVTDGGWGVTDSLWRATERILFGQ